MSYTHKSVLLSTPSAPPTSSSTRYRPVISPISELAWKRLGLSKIILADPLVPVRLLISCTSGTLDSFTPRKNCMAAASHATLLRGAATMGRLARGAPAALDLTTPAVEAATPSVMRSIT
eukprot:342785-Pelagomonas_calceolata.AAC.2